jgi:hypothetical protein
MPHHGQSEMVSLLFYHPDKCINRNIGLVAGSSTQQEDSHEWKAERVILETALQIPVKPTALLLLLNMCLKPSHQVLNRKLLTLLKEPSMRCLRRNQHVA